MDSGCQQIRWIVAQRISTPVETRDILTSMQEIPNMRNDSGIFYSYTFDQVQESYIDIFSAQDR